MPKTTLQVPPELDERIQAVAGRNHRSKHGQMLTWIERGVEQEEHQAELGALRAAVNAYETIQDPEDRAHWVTKAFATLAGNPAAKTRMVTYLIDRYGDAATIYRIANEVG